MTTAPRTVITAVSTATALLLSGCSQVLDIVDAGRSTDVEDLRDDLATDGYPAEALDCSIASLQEQGVDIDAGLSDADGDLIVFLNTYATEWAIAGQECLDEDDIAELFGDVDIADAKEGFIAGFVGSSGATEEQAECVYDEFVERGFQPSELVGQLSPEVASVLPEIFADCGVEGGDLSSMSAEEIRAAFITGFTAYTAADRDQSACVFDGMIAAGIAVEDFAGDVFTAEAEAAIGPIMQECGVDAAG